MQKAINAIFLIALTNLLFINALNHDQHVQGFLQRHHVEEGSHVRGQAQADISLQGRLDELHDTWNGVFKRLHLLANELFDDLAGEGRSEVPTAEFKESIQEIFPFSQEDVKKIPTPYADFWLVAVPDAGEGIDRDEAYLVIQNSIITGVLLNLFTDVHFKAAGDVEERVNTLIARIIDANNKLETINKAIFKLADTNQNGEIDLAEFKATYAAFLDPKADLEAEFSKLDVDNSGFLNFEETAHIIAKHLLGNIPFMHIKQRENNPTHSQIVRAVEKVQN
jgi:hypothetical protein